MQVTVVYTGSEQRWDGQNQTPPGEVYSQLVQAGVPRREIESYRIKEPDGSVPQILIPGKTYIVSKN